MNNFTILKAADYLRKEGTEAERDSIVDVEYVLRPLPKYEFNFATDIHYSQILNFGFSPSVDLTTRNVFGGAENLITSFSESLEQQKILKIRTRFSMLMNCLLRHLFSFPDWWFRLENIIS
jgi:hypothetical protein